MARNLSLSLLVLANHLHGPFIQSTNSYHFTNTRIFQSRLSRFSSHFFSTGSLSASLEAHKVSFGKFLASAIQIDTGLSENRVYVNEGCNVRETGNYTFFDCVFDTCSSTTTGGGIQMLGNTLDDSYLRIERCIFDTCNAGMHGGAIYALTSRYNVVDSCFIRCYAKEKQSVCLRGEYREGLNTLNLSVFARNGRGTRDKTTISVTSTVVALVDLNITLNYVAQRGAGAYIASNAFTFMKYSNVNDNTGMNVLNYQFRNPQSSCEYVNIINNTASVSWETLIYSNAEIAFGHYVFSQNSMPLIITDQKAGRVIFVDCTFDVPMEQRMFSGNVTFANCEFDIENPEIRVYSPMSKGMCVNRNRVTEEVVEGESKIWYLLGLLIIAGGVYFLFFYSPNEATKEERIPFLQRNRKGRD